MDAYVGRKFKIEAFKETGVLDRFGGLTDSVRTRELKKWALAYHRKDIRQMWDAAGTCQDAVKTSLGIHLT